MFDTLRTAALRMQALFTRRRLDQDFDQELDAHLTMLTGDNIRRGLTPEEAKR